MRILLVEDDPALGEGIRTALKPEAYTVDWLRDGASALHALSHESFDLAILDLGLPRLDGLQVLRRLRAAANPVPVLVLTARDATSDQEYVGFWQAAAFQWINPKSWLVSASAVGTYLQAQAGGALQQSLYFGALFVLAALPSCFVWLAFGAALQRFLRTERASRIFNVAMGALLAGSVILFIW